MCIYMYSSIDCIKLYTENIYSVKLHILNLSLALKTENAQKHSLQ